MDSIQMEQSHDVGIKGYLTPLREGIMCQTRTLILALVLGHFKIPAVIYCKMLLNVRCC